MDKLTLRHARELLGDLTQSALEDEAGVARGTVHDLEMGRNKRPSYETVTRVVRALRRLGLAGVTAEQLFPIAEAEAGADSSATQGAA